MLTLEEVKSLAATQKREVIAPKVQVKITSPAQRQEVITAARKVIAEHRDVLMALKDR
jgi:hypothetical protein